MADKSQVAQAYAEVRADLSNLPRDLSTVPSILKRLITTGAIAGAIGTAIGAISAGIARQTVNLQTEQLVRATGEAAGWSAEQLNRMAEAMRRATSFSGGQITAAQQALLKNPNIKGEQFQKALTAAGDLATVLGTDLPAAASGLGELLADPIKAAEGGLEKYGILLNAAEQGQIRNAVASRDFARAQELILSHLSRFSGAATEASTVGANGFEKLKNSLFAVAEKVGLTAGNIGGAAAQIGEFIEKAADLQIVQDAISAITYPFRALFDMISEFIENNKADFAAWGEYVSEIYHNFRDGFVAVWEFLEETIGEVLGAIGDLFGITWQDIKETVTAVLDEISLLTTDFGLTCELVWLKIQLGAQNLWDALRDGLAGIAVVFEATWDAVIAGAEAVWENIKAIFTGDDVKGIGESIQDAFMKGIEDGAKKYNFGDSPAALKLRKEIEDIRGEMEKKRDEKRDKRAAEERRKQEKREKEADPGKPSAGTPYVNTKPFKYEFVGFADMSKKIQEAIYPSEAMELQKAGLDAAQKAVVNGQKANGILAEIRDKVNNGGMKP